MPSAPAVDLHMTLAALFAEARDTGKPAKAQVMGVTVKASPNQKRLEFQAWQASGGMLGRKQVDDLAKAAGMISHVCQEITTEAGVAGLYVKDKADWAHLCLHSWNPAEAIDSAKEQGSLQTCQVCGSVAGVLEKKRSKKGPRQLYNGSEVHADVFPSLLSSGPLPLDLSPEAREVALAAVQTHLEAAAAPTQTAPAPIPAAQAPELPAPAAPSGPYKMGMPYPDKVAERVAGKLYWVDVQGGCVAFFTLERDAQKIGKDKTFSEHFASGYVWTPEVIGGTRKTVHFERLTASALAEYLKGFRLAKD